MIIYKITNLINDKIYVGQTSKTIDQRFLAHLKMAKKKVNRHLYDAMNHHGYDNFKIEEIETVSDKISADIREIFWISDLNSLSPNGYNMTIGGGGGNTLASWSDEDRAALFASQGNKRRGKRSAEWVESIRKGSILREQNKTVEKKQEISKKISDTLERKYSSGELVAVTPILYGEDNPNYTSVDIDDVCKLIKLQWKMKEIAEKYNTSKATVGSKLKAATGKTFTEWRRFYGIKGSFGRVSKIDE